MPGIVKLAGKSVLVAFAFISLQSYAGTDKGKLPDEKNFPSLLSNSANSPVLKRTADSIYDLVSLGEYGLERDVFFKAYKGYLYLLNRGTLRRTGLLTICDYSQSSNNKRLYVVDLANSRLLFNTFVSHGKNSGDEFATSFSNYDNSNKSSLGFMVTGGTYNGRAGFCLRLEGMEPGINDHVKSRGIVLHGSHFVNEDVMSARGTIGRSLGCPAVPFGIHYRIIDAIKGGSCFFINSPDLQYANNSRILNSTFDLAPSLQLQNNMAANADNSLMSTASTPVK